jgi:hypothetical protein
VYKIAKERALRLTMIKAKREAGQRPLMLYQSMTRTLRQPVIAKLRDSLVSQWKDKAFQELSQKIINKKMLALQGIG